KEGISWDWRRHQSALAEAAQKLNVERVFVGVQEVELGGVIEDHGNDDIPDVKVDEYADMEFNEYAAEGVDDQHEYQPEV
ncbi:MAG TPA: hypothetical protein DCY84_10300, partial [Firmicutes bacterium]|nr:hypothetical protein [Bacillota bacterium]